MTRVLVTGASGFIGRHTLPLLADRGYEVHAVGRHVPPRGPANASWHAADLLSEAERRRLIDTVQPEVLLHLAWYAEPGAFWTSTENLRWAAASIDLFRTAAAAGVRRIVGAGTCAEYDWTAGMCVERETPRDPATLYGAAKRATGMVLEAVGNTAGISTAWARVFFLYGPGDRSERLVGSTIARLLAGERAPATVGTQVRDFLHVADVAGGIIAVLDSKAEGPVNIGSGQGVAVRDVVMTLGRLANRPDLIGIGDLPGNPLEAPRVIADVRRLRTEIGWTPRFDLESGLAATLEWARRAAAEGPLVGRG
jgi:nucleoside-diphosphate-sugar epimerase